MTLNSVTSGPAEPDTLSSELLCMSQVPVRGGGHGRRVKSEEEDTEEMEVRRHGAELQDSRPAGVAKRAESRGDGLKTAVPLTNQTLGLEWTPPTLAGYSPPTE